MPARSDTPGRSVSSPTRTCRSGEGGMVVTDDAELARRRGCCAPTASPRTRGPATAATSRLRRARAGLQLSASTSPGLRSGSGCWRLDARQRAARPLAGATGGARRHRRCARRSPRAAQSAWHIFPLLLDPGWIGGVPGGLRERCPDERPLPAAPPDPGVRVRRQRVLPVTEDYARRTLTVPLFPHMTEAQQGRVVDAL